MICQKIYSKYSIHAAHLLMSFKLDMHQIFRPSEMLMFQLNISVDLL